MRLLVTRPQPDADAQAARLRELGHEAVVEPVLALEVRDPGRLPAADAQAVIVTSRNALRALDELGQIDAMVHLPLVAVGKATARLAERLGFATVHVGAGAAPTLVPLIREQCNPADGPLLYVTGEKTAFDLKPALAADGFEVVQSIVYAARPSTSLGAKTIEAIAAGNLDGVILMSAETARIYAQLMKEHKLESAAARLLHLCLSGNVADTLLDRFDARVAVAGRPTQDDLLALIAREAAN